MAVSMQISACEHRGALLELDVESTACVASTMEMRKELLLPTRAGWKDVEEASEGTENSDAVSVVALFGEEGRSSVDSGAHYQSRQTRHMVLCQPTSLIGSPRQSYQ